MLSARAVWMRGIGPLLAPLLPSSSHPASFVHGRAKLFCSVASTEQNDTNLVDVEARVGVVMNSLCSQGIVQYPKMQVTYLYQLLLDLGIKTDTIEAQLLEMPDLLSYSHKAWVNTCEVMVENGMSSLQIIQSIALLPNLLKLKPSLLNNKLLQYREMTIGKMNILNFAMKHPMLLLVEPSVIKGRMMNLTALFPPSELKNLVRNNPNVFTDNWEDIMAKIMYIHKEMGLEQPHIAATKCLRRPLLHIKTRHLFLLRAGLYKKPNLLRDKQSFRRNPCLMDILDTSDKRFTNRVAKLTDLEYSVFKAMMAVEEEDTKDLDDSDQSDEEEFKVSYKKRHR